MLPRQPLGELGIAPLQSFNDLQVIDNRTRGAIALSDGSPTDGAYVQQKVTCFFDDRLRAAETNHFGVEGNIGIGVFIQVL